MNIVGFGFVSYVGYSALQEVTWVTEDYMELHGVTRVTWSYRVSRGFTDGLQGVSGVYRALQGVTGEKVTRPCEYSRLRVC